jgi:hypothetical protein
MNSRNSAEIARNTNAVHASVVLAEPLIVEIGEPTRIRASSVSELFATLKHAPRILENSAPLNDVRRINEFLLALSQLLPQNAVYVARAQTISQRKAAFRRTFGERLFWVPYAFDFFLSRVVPKLSFLQQVYFAATKGRNRALSLTEILGRFAYCGFEIEGFEETGDLTVFRVRKIAPAREEVPTYGPLASITRVGRHGRRIAVYKIRTMHPFAEYIQDYVFQKNSVAAGGKIKDDFRVTSWGRLLRRLWIDELPMLINVVKGELKIVGVRPLSEHYFSLYPVALQELRTQFKPGLIPPFYADMPKTLDEIFASEERYLVAYRERPWRTDLQYGARALYNILVRRQRSA